MNGTPRHGHRSEFRQVLFIVMECSWLGAVLLLIDAAVSPPRTLAILATCLLYPMSYALGRGAGVLLLGLRNELVVSVGLFFAILAGLAGVLLVLAIPVATPLALVTIIGGISWIRGWILAGWPADLPRFVGAFQVGLVALIAVFALASTAGLHGIALPGLGAAFLVCGLTGIWHARIAVASPTGVGAPPAGSGGMVAVGMVGVVVTAAILWIAVDRSALDLLLIFVQNAWELVRNVLAFLLGLLPEKAGSPVEPMKPYEVPQHPRPVRPESQVRDIGGLLGPSLQIVFYGVLIAVALFVVIRGLPFIAAWLRRSRQYSAGVEHYPSSVRWGDTARALWRWARASLGRFNALLVRWLRRLRWRRIADGSARDVYRRMLIRLALRGWRRQAHETPDEYRRRLSAVSPPIAADMSAITRAFIADRYGPTRADAGESRRAWLRLRKQVRRLGFPHGR